MFNLKGEMQIVRYNLQSKHTKTPQEKNGCSFQNDPCLLTKGQTPDSFAARYGQQCISISSCPYLNICTNFKAGK